MLSIKKTEPTGDPVEPIYQYRPLTSDDETRLLTIEPAHDQSELIQCRLTQSSDISNDDYQTLSYAWGPTYNDGSHLTHHVVCDGGLIAVTANLHGALLQIRQDYAFNGIDASALPLWCDAICINQADVEERSKQVRLMGEIFASSSRLIIWLGSFASHHESTALRRLLDEYDTNEQRDMSQQSTAHQCSPILEKVLARPYFTRRWVIQEVVLTPGPRRWVFMGDQAFHYRTLERAMHNLQLRDMASCHEYWSSTWQLEYHEGDVRRPSSRTCRALSLLRNLELCSTMVCSDDRDRVFALLGISTTFEGFGAVQHVVVQPDYTLTAEQLYLKLAIRYGGSKKYAIALLACAAARAPMAGCNRSLPSWAPDWRLSMYNGNPIQHSVSMILHDCIPGMWCRQTDPDRYPEPAEPGQDNDREQHAEEYLHYCPYALDMAPYVSADCKILHILGHVTRRPLGDDDMDRRPALTKNQTYLLLSSSPTAFLLETVSGTPDHPEDAIFRLLSCHKLTYPRSPDAEVFPSDFDRYGELKRPVHDVVWLEWRRQLQSAPQQWIAIA
ncbi:hypothetical protein LTR97_003327 [Elasticomyces elasticus]|uniref:Heterokaryon incompatibility domain-containing protein n=1 Tax=Elasticomyces elasticus TaxID=574655 RepID=A0AAN8A4G4_9PEZI|nr:hypothetical protein LTR97_003327 [Elasticomyces elasticus]KAK5725479.1 hypothetical protein LTR15_003665 [Elasticomyces elasticus]